MKNKHIIPVVLICLIIPLRSKGQGSDARRDEYTEDVLESVAGNDEGSKDLSSLLTDLDEYKAHPLNLNSATKEQLESLNLLNDFQVAMLLDYRKRSGGIKSIYELLYVPGFRKEDVENLKPYVSCAQYSNKYEENGNGLKYLHQQLLMRWQRVLEQQQGYISLSDSELAVNPDKSRYLGSPDKLFIRYHAQAGQRYEAGMVMEKDAGEEFFRGSNRKGFDLYSGFVGGTPARGPLKAWMAGDYHIRLGQGLLCWSSYSPGIIPEISTINKKGQHVRGNLTAEENRFFRGFATEAGTEKIRLLTFCSYRDLDATLIDSADFSNFTVTGYHATPADLKKQNTVKQFTAGGSLHYNSTRLFLGINGIYYHFNKTMVPDDKLYKALSFHGNENEGISVDYKYLAGRLQLFGETALSNGHLASLNGLILYLNSDLNISFVHLDYSPYYYSYYAGSIGENSGTTNEKGFLVQTAFRFSDFSIKAYADIFSFPWLRYRVNVPSQGTEMLFQCSRITQKNVLQLRYKYKQNLTSQTSEDPLDSLVAGTRQSIRLNARFNLSDKFSTQSRCELGLYRAGTGNFMKGIMLFQDLTIHQEKIPLQWNFRVTWFDAPDYNARIYAYEKDVLYAYSSQQFYGKGWRWMCLIEWKPLDQLAFWLKISQSLYPGQDEIGSSLATIKGYHKTEVKLQVLLTLR